MTYQIRPMRRDDVPPAFTLIHQVYPCLVVTETLMLERFDRPLTHYRDRHFVAVEGDALVGHIRTRLYPDITGRLQGRAYMTAVASGHHGGALHGDLLQIAERHLLDHGAHVLWAYAAQEEVQVDGEHFRQTVLDRGYERTESTQVLGLALSELPLSPPAPQGAELRPFTEYQDDPRPIYEIDRLAYGDEPGEGDDAFPPYDEWLRAVWDNPLVDKDISLVLLMEGVPVTISLCLSDGAARVESGTTGTLRAYRGQGLAGYIKAKALQRAQGKGITHAYTGNHADNEPMLAINERLGYTVVGSEETYLRP